MSNHSQFASDEIERLLRANGICDLESAFRLGGPLDELHEKLATRHPTRRVVKFELAGSPSETVYIKREWGRETWMPRPTDIVHRLRLLCAPIHEWRGLQILQGAGFHVSEPLALFWKGWGLSRGAIVTRAVPPARSMSDMLLRGEFERMEVAKRDSLIEAATKVVARLHRERIAWRSMKPKHFYPEDLGRGKWRIWLIDCEGVYRTASRRACDRQWQMYLKHFTTRTPALQNTFLAAYRMALAA